MGFSQSILTPNTIGWLVLLIFQLCADRIKLPWWRLRLCGGLACSRNLAHYSRKQFVAVAAFDYGMFICFESPPCLLGKPLTYLCKLTVQTQPCCFDAGTLLSLDKCQGWVSDEWKHSQSAVASFYKEKGKSLEKFSYVFLVMKIQISY